MINLRNMLAAAAMFVCGTASAMELRYVLDPPRGTPHLLGGENPAVILATNHGIAHLHDDGSVVWSSVAPEPGLQVLVSKDEDNFWAFTHHHIRRFRHGITEAEQAVTFPAAAMEGQVARDGSVVLVTSREPAGLLRFDVYHAYTLDHLASHTTAGNAAALTRTLSDTDTVVHWADGNALRSWNFVTDEVSTSPHQISGEHVLQVHSIDGVPHVNSLTSTSSCTFSREEIIPFWYITITYYNATLNMDQWLENLSTGQAVRHVVTRYDAETTNCPTADQTKFVYSQWGSRQLAYPWLALNAEETKYVQFGYGHIVWVYDLEGTLLKTITHELQPATVHELDRGDVLVHGTRLLNPADGTEIGTLPRETGMIAPVSHENLLVGVQSYWHNPPQPDRELEVWDVDTKQLLSTRLVLQDAPSYNSPISIDISPDGSRVLVRQHYRVEVYSLSNPADETPLQSINLSPDRWHYYGGALIDNNHIVVGSSHSHSMRLEEYALSPGTYTRTRIITTTLPLPELKHDTDIATVTNSDRTRLLYGGAVYDIATGALLLQSNAPSPWYTGALSRDGRFAAFVENDSLIVRNVDSRAEIDRTLVRQDPHNEAWSLQFGRDPERLYAYVHNGFHRQMAFGIDSALLQRGTVLAAVLGHADGQPADDHNFDFLVDAADLIPTPE